MASITNAAPQAILQGIKDVSGRPPVIDPEQIPSHLAHVYTYAQKGPTLPQLVVGDNLVRMYGASTFEYRSKYATHQTPLINILNGAANSMMVQRLVPADASTAFLRLSVDVVADKIPQWTRTLSGGFKVGVDGQRIPLAGAEPVDGYRLSWIIEAMAEGEEFGKAGEKVGTLVSGAGEASTIYPIHEFQVADPGDYGNLIGLRLSAPTTQSATPVDDATALSQAAYLYRLAIVERATAQTTPNLVETLSGGLFVDFSYKAGAINTSTDVELFADDAILQAWEQPPARGEVPTYGRFGRMHAYYDNIEAVLGMLQVAEAPMGLVSAAPADLHLVNFIGATDLNGVPYYAVVVEGPSSGGVLLTENSTHYAKGGSDGTMSAAAFDALVANETANYGDLEADLLDDAVYPQSVIYDTGFTLETKKSLLTVLGRRKDMYVVLSTQDVSRPQNIPAEETSIATALRTAARMYPESEVFGTPVCRALVLGHAGRLVGIPWKYLSCMTLDFAQKCATFMGAGNGIWKPGFGFDMPPNNQITLLRDVNAPFKRATQRSRDWAAGLVWVQSYDRSSLFCPAYQTVYDDDTSVLNSATNMMVAVELEKVAQRVWRDLVGITKLTPQQFVERSNRLIQDACKGRFDDRVVIVANTYYTANDSQRGYSWSCEINMYGNNMKTVGTYTIVARRREDLVA